MKRWTSLFEIPPFFWHVDFVCRLVCQWHLYQRQVAGWFLSRRFIWMTFNVTFPTERHWKWKHGGFDFEIKWCIVNDDSDIKSFVFFLLQQSSVPWLSGEFIPSYVVSFTCSSGAAALFFVLEELPHSCFYGIVKFRSNPNWAEFSLVSATRIILSTWFSL